MRVEIKEGTALYAWLGKSHPRLLEFPYVEINETTLRERIEECGQSHPNYAPEAQVMWAQYQVICEQENRKKKKAEENELHVEPYTPTGRERRPRR